MGCSNLRVLFLTLARISSIEHRGNYQDLIRKIRNEDNEVVVVTPSERRYGASTTISYEGNGMLIKVWVPNIQKANLLEKGIGTLLIEFLYMWALIKCFSKPNFDLILYSTPPITFVRLIKWLKWKTNAKTYLLLKDIFPQNAVDLKLMSSKGNMYKYFRKLEEELYSISDRIGCMSKANMDYIIEHNTWIPPEKIEVNPNSIEILKSPEIMTKESSFTDMLKGKTVLVYGGNLGKPQNIEFLIEAITACQDIPGAFFLIVGSGTESGKIEDWISSTSPQNALYISELPREEYDLLLLECHVGLIFLHPDFTIPNYPSRILPYMQNKMPVICATDQNTDIGKDAVESNYGFSCRSGDAEQFREYVETLARNEKLRIRMGENGYEYLLSNFNVDISYDLIHNHVQV